MLPRRFYKLMGIRIKLCLLGGGTYYLWDPEKEELKMAQPFQIMPMYMGLYFGGAFFVSIHVIQMYLRTHPMEIPEEGASSLEPTTDLKAFATLMIEGGEILLVICLSFLNLVFLNRLDIFKFLFNQLLHYNKKLSKMIESGKLTLTPDQKMVVRVTEVLLYAVMWISVLLPFGVTASVLAKIEPTHQLIHDWLEVRFQFNWAFSPFILVMLASAYGVGTTVSLMMLVIALYYMIATLSTEAFTPEDLIWTPKKGAGRCNLVTKCFATIPDLEVIQLYRTQQILNVQLNAFFKSVLVAFHHVGCLATVVVLFVFVVKYNEVLNEHGPIGYLVVFSSMGAIMLMIFFQAKMAGMVVDISEDFKFSGKQFVPRRFLFRKFTRCCTTFYIQVAYPFYTVHKETFSMFCEQVQEYSMEFLLS